MVILFLFSLNLSHLSASRGSVPPAAHPISPCPALCPQGQGWAALATLPASPPPAHTEPQPLGYCLQTPNCPPGILLCL